MRITENTLSFYNEKGLNHIRESIIRGLRKELSINGGENGDFDAVCEMWEDLEKNPSLLPHIVRELNISDMEDMFGSEGWEHVFGLED